MDVPASAFETSIGLLRRPEVWITKQGDTDVSDQYLVRIQFVAALGEADGADVDARTEAAQLVTQDQGDDGAWSIEEENPVGSPVTCGSPIATWLMTRFLARTDPGHFASEIRRGREWLGNQSSSTLPARADRALAHGSDDVAVKKIVAAQNSDGGWGQHENYPSEAFDTSLALLAIADSDGEAEARARGRTYLIDRQLESGSWSETMRLSGGDSYPRHVSTMAWAAIALIKTH